MTNQSTMININGVRGIFKSKVSSTSSLAAISILNKDSALISLSQKLKDLLGDVSYLDQVVLRMYMEEHDALAWKEVLEDVENAISKAENRDEQIIQELLCLVTNTLKACVEGKLLNHMEVTLIWFDLANKLHVFCDEMKLKRNHSAIIRASRKNDLASVDVLFKYGFRAASRLAYDFFGHHAGMRNDVLLELNFLEAMTSPAYLFAEYKHRDKHVDPVCRAFNHLQTCHELSKSMKAYSNKLDNIGIGLKKFTCHMLDLCNGRDQVELFLAEDDAINGLSINDSSIMPRIYQALQLEHKEFVTHDNCQQVLRKVFYDQQYDKFKGSSMFSKLWHGIMQVILIPVYVIMHILAKFKLRCCKSKKTQLFNDQESAHGDDSNETEKYFYEIWYKDSKIPFNRLIMQIACYLFFLTWILLTLINHEHDNSNQMDLNPPDILAGLWALGYILSDLNLMFQISESVSMRGSNIDLYIARLVKFFSNNFFNYRLLSHVIYFCGIVTESVGYFLDTASKDIIDLGCNPVDPRAYSGFSLVKTGISLQGIGVVMVFTHIFQVLRLHLNIGSLYVAIRMCISIVFSFILTYGIITIAFALGLHFILRHSVEICDEAGLPVTLSCNESFVTQRRHVGVYCLTVTNSRVVCPDECWIKWTEDPGNEAYWKDACMSNHSGFLRPKINADDKNTGGEEIVQLDTKKNRFTSFYVSIKTLFWTLFDPGHPEVVGCSEGSSRYAALFLWIVYNAILLIILLNLLIALMNVAMTDVVEDRVASWKYHRTQVWMDFCNQNVVLPSPFNLLSLIADILKYILCKPCQTCCKITTDQEKDTTSSMKKLMYHELSRILVTKYLNDMEAFEEVDSNNIAQLGRELKKLMKDNSDESVKRMKSLRKILLQVGQNKGVRL